MKISTIKNPITHERKIQYENDRANPIEELIATIDSMIEELCPIDEVAECMIDTLRMMNPDVKEVIADEHVVVLEVGTIIKEVNITGFTFPDLYTTLIAEVLRQ